METISKANIRTWSRLGQRGTIFAGAMLELAEKKDNLKLLTADLSLLSGMDRFIRQYPEKFLNVGIAEQNMMGIAAGLAMEGDCVFATTYASFIAVRSLEHIRQHMANVCCNVKAVGSAAGVVAARSGVSHWATEDIAFLRALPNLIVLSPADSLEAYKMTIAAAEYEGPVYIRVSGGVNCPIVYEEDYDFQIGKAVQLKKGTDVAIIATGLMVKEALMAAEKLSEDNISCSVINMHTIKPLDTGMLDKVFEEHKLVVTVEEHNVIGGLGSAVAEYKASVRNAPPQMFIGFRDFNVKAGSQKYIWEQVGLTAEKIAEQIKKSEVL